MGKLSNSYYLTHIFSGEEHISGCIFMDCINEPDFTDDNTILYGQNMKDGSMFGSIQRFQADTATVFLYTPEETDTYEVIDNLVADVRDEKYFRTVYSKEDFDALSEDVAVRTENRQGYGEHLLTLSTCNGNASKRHLILCRKAAEAGEEETDTGGTDPVTQIETKQSQQDGDLSDLVKPRLVQAGAELSHVYAVNDMLPVVTLGDERFEQLVENYDIRMIIIDPIQEYLEHDVYKDTQDMTYPVLYKLEKLAKESGCAVVLTAYSDGAGSRHGEVSSPYQNYIFLHNGDPRKLIDGYTVTCGYHIASAFAYGRLPRPGISPEGMEELEKMLNEIK